MKKFLNKGPETDAPKPIPIEQEIVQDDFHPEPIIPEYMINDPQFVGYSSIQEQMDIYQIASHGHFGIETKSILDVGCGRGDFSRFIIEHVKSDIQYFGIDKNPIMNTIADIKYPGINITHVDFDVLLAPLSPYDWVFHINNLSVNYGNIKPDETKYDYLQSVISKSLSISKDGVILILNSDSEDENIITHSIDKVVMILKDMNVRFAIDNTDIRNTYKVIIYNKPF